MDPAIMSSEEFAGRTAHRGRASLTPMGMHPLLLAVGL
jgi:hypothetical protein